MINRDISNKILHLAEKFPVISVTGPRQSGKTTLLKSLFPDYRYESLENPDVRIFAQSDTRRFLGRGQKMILDEIQRVPEIFSYLQTEVDNTGMDGQFIISGSQSFLLNHHISQSLAGRVATFNLLPLSISEMVNHGFNLAGPEKMIYNGFYPRMFDKNIEPADFYPNYLQTYVERDVRLLQNIQDLNLFIRFLKICAGRTGQLVNMNSIATDCGIGANTVKAWLSVLEASYLIFLLMPHHVNFNKRLVKMPKLYFTDTGLACFLLDIHSENQLHTHYMRGPLFENLILSEFLKGRFNRGLRSNLFFWRDNKGIEIDCILEDGAELIPVEMKSGFTFNQEFFRNLSYWNRMGGYAADNGYVIYAGDITRETGNGKLLSWKDFNQVQDIGDV